MDDLLRGYPIPYKDNQIAFRSVGLLDFLNKYRKFDITERALYALLRANGATWESSPTKIRRKSVHIWLIPMDRVNIQMEDYAVPEFTKIENEM